MSQEGRGKFITIEGVEGVGKSTQLAAIQRLLESRGIDYHLTREPGGTQISESIRELILSLSDEDVDANCELLLIFAARAQHIAQVIEPRLAAGQWVLCDRFTDATYAYQGGGRQLGVERIAELEAMVQGELRPDITVLLDLEPQIGLARAAQRGALDRIESEQADFFTRVRDTYLALAQQHAERFLVIDASAELVDVEQELLARLTDKLGFTDNE
ncbi:MAG: dTMP kinase [Gammaproteobacteria bacterium]